MPERTYLKGTAAGRRKIVNMLGTCKQNTIWKYKIVTPPYPDKLIGIKMMITNDYASAL